MQCFQRRFQTFMGSRSGFVLNELKSPHHPHTILTQEIADMHGLKAREVSLSEDQAYEVGVEVLIYSMVLM